MDFVLVGVDGAFLLSVEDNLGGVVLVDDICGLANVLFGLANNAVELVLVVLAAVAATAVVTVVLGLAIDLVDPNFVRLY